MTDQPTTAIYLSPSGPALKTIKERYQPNGSQSLIRVEYSGINPADVKHASIGLHSSVAGYDIAGEVVAVGPSSPFCLHDKVFGMNIPSPGRPLYMGAHQDFAIADSDFFYLVPTEKMTIREAAVLPVMTSTASDGLFNLLGLSFQAAGVHGNGAQSILIWGGATSIGVAAIQLAKAAGHGPIFVTASSKHHATLKTLGADFCFDYNDRSVVEQIRETIQSSGKPVRHIFDTVGAGALAQGDEFLGSSPTLAAKCVSEASTTEEQDAKFACVMPVPRDPRWQMCLAMRSADNPFPGDVAATPVAWQEMQNKVIAWVSENYGEGKYYFPNIRCVRGASQCLEAMVWSAAGKSSLEKIVVEHPL